MFVVQTILESDRSLQFKELKKDFPNENRVLRDRSLSHSMKPSRYLLDTYLVSTWYLLGTY